jgi:uncharacterized protein (TIGR02246 family)
MEKTMLKRTAVIAMLALGSMFWHSAWAESVRDALNQAEQTWARLYNAKDADGLAKRYVEDAMRLPPDTSRHQGRAAIQANLQKEFDGGVTNCKLQVTDVGSDGNLAWLVGNFSVDYPAEGGKMATATGNYVSVYRKEADGIWRTVLDTWNDTPSQ